LSSERSCYRTWRCFDSVTHDNDNDDDDDDDARSASVPATNWLLFFSLTRAPAAQPQESTRRAASCWAKGSCRWTVCRPATGTSPSRPRPTSRWPFPCSSATSSCRFTCPTASEVGRPGPLRVPFESPMRRDLLQNRRPSLGRNLEHTRHVVLGSPRAQVGASAPFIRVLQGTGRFGLADCGTSGPLADTPPPSIHYHKVPL
jgi:hypothetical protein